MFVDVLSLQPFFHYKHCVKTPVGRSVKTHKIALTLHILAEQGNLGFPSFVTVHHHHCHFQCNTPIALHYPENDDDDGDDLYIMVKCVCVCVQKSLFRYTKDLAVSPVSRHFPYSRYLVISPVYRHFPHLKVSRNI